MKIDVIEPETALVQGLLLPFSFIRSLSGVTLGPAPAHIDAEELLEARFFDEHCEIRVFRYEDTLFAARLEEEPDDRFLQKEYPLDNQKKFGVRVTERCYLDTETDEDGQSFISAVRLAGWRGA